MWGWWWGHKEAAQSSAWWYQCAVCGGQQPRPALLTTQCYRWLIDSQNSQNSAASGKHFLRRVFSLQTPVRTQLWLQHTDTNKWKYILKLNVKSTIWSCFLLWYFHQWMWGESDVIMLYRRHNIELSTSSPHLQSPAKYLISRLAVWGQATPCISSPLFAKNICENVLN